ncbi:MAG: transaldolase [Ilumatobacter sp.]|uniref:transaldolase n=1 Tax=Ilumatobacter sp. TaxID=1967498 RepID=UPI002612C12F|nr:transaldolase [Ilumatobacter sp.]MDJ0769452.1 transaldolase [Ilumatobacter sp.]
MSRLTALSDDFQQSPWLDNLKRSYLTSGQLREIRDRGVRGLTSNPTIFQKAIQGSADYDEQFRELAADPHPVIDDYWAMVLADIHGACDVFSKVYDETDGRDGYVSVEVDPGLAHDGPGTEAAARDLHTRLKRRNLMVKIPATVEGLPAVQQMIAEGRNINVTLIFSLDRHQAVMDAYIAGLEQLAGDPAADLSRVASVASFFISRVDVEVDRRLEAIGTPEALALRGRAGLAQGRLAYRRFAETFSGPRWDALAARGARVQRPLWASTGTKNPEYSDVLYVDGLIGPDTVNTLPEHTMEAFADHGVLERTVDADPAETDRVWQGLADVGVDMDEVAEQLEREGVDSFMKSFDELISALEAKSAELDAG